MYLSIDTAEAVRRDSSHAGRLPNYGRFLQADPIGYEAGANLYAYVGNDPINFVDPLGLCDENVDTAYDGSGGGGGCDGNVTRVEEVIVIGSMTAPPPLDGSLLLSVIMLPGVSSAVLRPGPFAGKPDPNVICGSDCEHEVTVQARPKGSTPFYFNGTAWVIDPHYKKPWFSDYFDACFLTPLCGAAGGATLAFGGPAVAGRMATSPTFGVASSRFGNAFYAGRAGSWNHGPVRIGWSYRATDGLMYFQPRIGGHHVPTFLKTAPPY